MLIFHSGHSEFLLEYANGYRILTDPFDAHVGYPMQAVRCDAVTVSHAHGDHNATEKAQGFTTLIDQSGTVHPAPGVTVTCVDSYHDEQQGALRGNNRIYIIEAEGLRIAHLGDLGAWDEALAARLSDLDILFVPVGGYYTMDAQSAATLCRHIAPRIVIPMHYKTQANADWPIAPVTDFLRILEVQDTPCMPLLRVTAKDLSQQPRVAVLLDGGTPRA